MKYIPCAAVLFILGAILPLQSAYSDKQGFTGADHTFEGYTLPYRLFTPKKYREDASYPLIIFLHGAGARYERENGLPVKNEPQIGYYTDQFLRFFTGEVQSTFPHFIVAPNLAYKINGEEQWWSGSRWSNDA